MLRAGAGWRLRARSRIERSASCPICGQAKFKQIPVLWPALIEEWSLTDEETAMVNRQQGWTCVSCGACMRAMSLAKALTRAFGTPGLPLREAVAKIRACAILEVNEAAQLAPLLASIDGHVLVEYPAVDMRDLPFDASCFDVVVHSDTLEHIAQPVEALAECHRVLRPGGYLCFTVPMVPGRTTTRRPADAPSYHGTQQEPNFLVHTEYGADAWVEVMNAGFAEISLIPYEHPTSYAFLARKSPAARTQS